MNKLHIQTVSTKSEKSEFINLPWSIYIEPTMWVPPLKSEVKHLLDTKRHPFWRFSEQVLFLAKREGKVVGRIAGIINNNHNEYHKEKAAFWGFFECMDDQEAAEALFENVEQWSKAKGMTLCRGPMNPSTNYEIGLLVEGFHLAPAIMMPYNPEYYEKLITNCGYTKEMDIYSFIYRLGDHDPEKLSRLVRRYKDRHDATVDITSKKSFDRDLLLAKDIYDEAWADNWCFSPMTEDEMKEAAKNLVRIAEPEQFFYVNLDSKPVAVVIMPVDVNPLLKKMNGSIGISGLYHLLRAKKYISGLRMMLFGVKKKFWRTGVPLMVFDYCLRYMTEHNFEYLEMGWTLEDNKAVNQWAEGVGGKRCKTYRLFRKDL